MSYFIKPLVKNTEADFEFPLPITELAQPEENQDMTAETPEAGVEDRSLGEINVPLSARWIRDQLVDGKLPPVGLEAEDV